MNADQLLPVGAWRNILPTLTVLLAVVLDCLPLPNSGPTAAAPLLTLCAVFFWVIYRPNLLGAPVIFGVTILLDAWSDLPLGMTALAFLLPRAALLPKDRFLSSSPFVVVWCCFALASALTLGIRWLLTCYWWGQWMPAGAALIEWLLTMLFYPFVSHLLIISMRYLPRLRHAPGS